MQIKAIRLYETGGPEVMKYEACELASPEGAEVLVRHEAVAVNFIDIYQRSGLYPLSFPSGLGSEAAGVVEAIGDKVTRFKVGDKVAYAGGTINGYSEANLVTEDNLVKVPEGISSKQAAGMLLKGLTAAYLLLKTYPVKSGQWLLTHAATGGVGSILTQWASSLGVNVIGTVGRQEKAALAKEQGCNHVLLYREEDVPAAVDKITEGVGVDVVYDSVGKDTFDMSLDSLKKRGMMVSFGNASGAIPPFAPLLLVQKGSLFFTRPTLYDYIDTPEELQELADALFAKVLSGDIKVNVNYEFPLSNAAEAHETLKSGLTTGSIVLIP